MMHLIARIRFRFWYALANFKFLSDNKTVKRGVEDAYYDYLNRRVELWTLAMANGGVTKVRCSRDKALQLAMKQGAILHVDDYYCVIAFTSHTNSSNPNQKGN